MVNAIYIAAVRDQRRDPFDVYSVDLHSKICLEFSGFERSKGVGIYSPLSVFRDDLTNRVIGADA